MVTFLKRKKSNPRMLKYFKNKLKEKENGNLQKGK